jgi:hypothetical protein
MGGVNKNVLRGEVLSEAEKLQQKINKTSGQRITLDEAIDLVQSELDNTDSRLRNTTYKIWP